MTAALKTAELWVAEHMLDLADDQDTLDAVLPLLPQTGRLPPRLRARLALATLRCKLDAGEEIDACRILLALDVFAAARHLPDADALATTGAHVAAAVIFRRAQNWTEFDDLFREFFVDGAAARAADVRDAVAKARAESAKPAARKKGVSPRPTAGGVTAAYDKIREEYAMDDEELRGAFERMMRRAAEILGADSVSKIADDVASGDYDVASHAAAIRSHEPNERPVDPFATRPSPARKKKGLLRTPTKGKKIASSSPEEKTLGEDRPKKTTRDPEDDPFAFRDDDDDAPGGGADGSNPWESLGAEAEGARWKKAPPLKKAPPPPSSPVARVARALGWRKAGGGIGEDRGASGDESDSERGADAENIAPTQAAPDDDPDEEAIQTRDRSRGRKSLFAAVTGALGFGTAAAAKSEAAEAKRARAAADLESSDEEDAIATTPVRKRKRAPGRPRKETPIGRANRHSRRKVLAAGGAPSPGSPRGGLPRKKKTYWTAEEVEALRAGVRAHGEGKWAAIHDANEAIFAPRERTLMDLKDKWRNLERAKARPVVARASGEEGGEGGSGAAAPASPRWRRFLALPAMLGGGGSPRGASASAADASSGLALEEAAKKPRQPGVANRHSAYRKLAGADDGSRKTRAPWLEEEVAALRLGVETFGEGKWAEIVREFADVLVDRTSMDVKDKWRNLEMKRKKDEQKAADKEVRDSS